MAKQPHHKQNVHVEEYTLPDNVVLQISHMTMTFGGLRAVDDLSFSIKEGEIFGLIGPNGAGKTTVFNCITQFYPSNTGTVLFRTQSGAIINLNEIPVDKVISYGLARTFQNVELIKDLTILQNILIGAHHLYSHTLLDEIFRTRTCKKEEKDMASKGLEILRLLGIDHLAYSLAMSLPYGIAKKVELARTLMSNPSLIILDEPAAGLNDEETADLAVTLRTIRDQYECTILLVEHDMHLVMDVCDTICAISFGKLLAVGTSGEIQRNTLVQEAYLGKADA